MPGEDDRNARQATLDGLPDDVRARSHVNVLVPSRAVAGRSGDDEVDVGAEQRG